MKKNLFFIAFLSNILWISCSNNSSQPGWTSPPLPIHEGIGIVADRVGGLGNEMLIVKVGKEDFTVMFTKEFAAQMDSAQIGDYIRFKASDNETLAFERIKNIPEKELQSAVYFRIVK